MLKNDFIVKVNKTSLILKADTETLSDIAIVLDHLVNIVHTLRIKAQREESRQNRQQRSDQIKTTADNRTRSTEIYTRYLTHLNNGCNGNITAARNETAKEYNLQIVTTKYFIAEGRKLWKEEQKKKQCILF